MNNIIRWGRNIVTVFGIYYAITNALWGWILLSIAIWFFIVQPFGLVIGRHRYLVHRSFEARNNFIHIWLMNLIYSIEVDEKGITKTYYKSNKEINIRWGDIVSVEKSPMKIPLQLRLIKSSKGEAIDVLSPQKGYRELINLIKQRATNIEKIED